MKRVRKAVFPVAGLGTRFLPATKSIPKEMLTVVDRPVIQYVVDEAREAGIEHFIFVTGRNKGVIEDHFDLQFELNETLAQRGKTEQLEYLKKLQPGPGQTSFTRQQVPLGLGHAVWCARDLVGEEPFALLLPDMIMQSEKSCLKEMVELYGETGNNIIAVQECDPAETHKYGIVGKGKDVHNGFEITQMVEKPKAGTAPSNLFINADTSCSRRYSRFWRARSGAPATRSSLQMRCSSWKNASLSSVITIAAAPMIAGRRKGSWKPTSLSRWRSRRCGAACWRCWNASSPISIPARRKPRNRWARALELRFSAGPSNRGRRCWPCRHGLRCCFPAPHSAAAR
jgi:UTP-glucose-1-phosphate uridylyltransferase